MLKTMMLLAVLCCAGCQTPQPASEKTPYQDSSRRAEKISVRVEKYVTSYDVEVQRAVRVYSEDGEADHWQVVSAPRVSGYPEKWRATEATVNPSAYAAKASYLLDGEMLEISLEPGAHLIAKVLPEKQNTARVVGVFSQSKISDQGMEVFSVPFDLSCTFGELTVVYLEEIDIDAVMMSVGQ